MTCLPIGNSSVRLNSLFGSGKLQTQKERNAFYKHGDKLEDASLPVTRKLWTHVSPLPSLGPQAEGCHELVQTSSASTPPFVPRIEPFPFLRPARATDSNGHDYIYIGDRLQVVVGGLLNPKCPPTGPQLKNQYMPNRPPLSELRCRAAPSSSESNLARRRP